MFQPTFASLLPVPCRWSMHRTGKYKSINLTFGIFPFIATMLISTMNENSSPARLWLSIVRNGPTATRQAPNITQIPLGFGNAVVLQTMLSESLRESSLLLLYSLFKLLSWPTSLVSRTILSRTHSVDRHAPLLESAMAVGTGFGQIFRSVGQVCGVARVVELSLTHRLV